MKLKRASVLLAIGCAIIAAPGMGFASWLLLAANGRAFGIFNADAAVTSVEPTSVDIIQDLQVDPVNYSKHYGFVVNDAYTNQATLSGTFAFNISTALLALESFGKTANGISSFTFDLTFGLSGFGSAGLGSNNFSVSLIKIFRLGVSDFENSEYSTSLVSTSENKSLVATIPSMAYIGGKTDGTFSLKFAIALAYGGTYNSNSGSFPNLASAGLTLSLLAKEASE